MKSLYINPQKVEKNPMSKSMYLISTKALKDSLFLRFLLQSHSIIPIMKMKEPWPTSPNITPKRNGKVIIQKYAGLISL